MKRMTKTLASILFWSVTCSMLLSGCGKEKQQDDPGGQSFKGAAGTEREKVSLTVWGAKEDAELLAQIIQSFQEEYKDQADFQITCQEQGETGCKDALLGNLEEGADVFAFADDQLNALAAAGAVEPVEGADEIKAAHLDRAVEAASVGNTLYAYPLTADNGYFLYYNKQYFTQKDIQSLEKMLDTAAENKKLLTMDWSSAWYVYAFFGNTGLETGLNEDGITNYCDWNKKDTEIRGVDVAQSMLNIAQSPGFASRTDEEFMEGVRDGTVIAGVSGVWNAVALKEIWGEDLGAAKLPAYECRGRQIQMASFCGCKLIGVNAYSGQKEWAGKLAEWIINEQNQRLRFEMRGQGPSDKKAAESAEVQDSPAIAALLAQSEYSQLQRIGGNFWQPVADFAGNMAAGNATGEDLQKQLDVMVEKITAR